MVYNYFQKYFSNKALLKKYCKNIFHCCLHMFVQLTFFVIQRAWPNLAIIFSAHSRRDFQISLRVNIYIYIYIYTSSFPYKRIKSLVQASFLLVQAKESQLLVHLFPSVYFCVRYSVNFFFV